MPTCTRADPRDGGRNAHPNCTSIFRIDTRRSHRVGFHQAARRPHRLVIPDTAKEKPQEGEVLAVGPGRWNEDGDERIPLDVKVGDRVIYSKYGGTEIKHGGQEFLILSARDVLAVVG